MYAMNKPVTLNIYPRLNFSLMSSSKQLKKSDYEEVDYKEVDLESVLL